MPHKKLVLNKRKKKSKRKQRRELISTNTGAFESYGIYG